MIDFLSSINIRCLSASVCVISPVISATTICGINISGTVATASNATCLNGQLASYYQTASNAITTSNIGSQTVATAGNSSCLGGTLATNYIFGCNGSGSNTACPTAFCPYELPMYKSGFWSTGSAVWTPTTDWYWGLTAAHTNNCSVNNYGLQLIGQGTGTNVGTDFYLRAIAGGTACAWRKVIHDGNISTQSVGNAACLGGNLANTYAPLASPSFTGSVEVDGYIRSSGRIIGGGLSSVNATTIFQGKIDTTLSYQSYMGFKDESNTIGFSVSNGTAAGNFFPIFSGKVTSTMPGLYFVGNAVNGVPAGTAIIGFDGRVNNLAAASTDMIAGFASGYGSYKVKICGDGTICSLGCVAGTCFIGSGAGLTGTASSLTTGNASCLGGTLAACYARLDISNNFSCNACFGTSLANAATGTLNYIDTGNAFSNGATGANLKIYLHREGTVSSNYGFSVGSSGDIQHFVGLSSGAHAFYANDVKIGCITCNLTIFNGIICTSTCFAGSGAGLTGTASSLTAGAANRVYTDTLDNTSRTVYNTNGSYYAGISGIIGNRLSMVLYNSPNGANANAVASYQLYTTADFSPSSFFQYQCFTLDANTMTSRRDGFTYSVNAPHTGPIMMIGEPNYSLQINAGYISDEMSFRTRQGDSSCWNTWKSVISSGNIGSQSVNYANSAGSAPANGGTSSYVTINYNNDSNSTYQVLWGSSTSVYGTGGVYINPYYDYLYATDVIANSDCRLKKDIEPITNALSMVLKLQGVYYNLCSHPDEKKEIGFLAQDVEKVIPAVIACSEPTEDDKKYGIDDLKLGIKYEKITALLVEAIKEQQKQINSLSLELNYMRNINK